jgi:GTPase
MRFRCDEGAGEATYELGVSDNGDILGMSKHEYEETMETLSQAVEINNYSITLITSTNVDDVDDGEEEKKIYEVLIREKNENEYIDIKVAVAGSVDAGKTTLIGSLTTGRLDDGRGLSRLSVFNFEHEVKSGRTSSVGHRILGFDEMGRVVNYRLGPKPTWPQIVAGSSKILSIADLAGHLKYLKTTITGLATSHPDLCLIIVGANRGVLQMTKEHIFLCVTLGIPFAIVITKVDMIKECKDVMKETMQTIKKILKFPLVRRTGVTVKTEADMILCAKRVATETIAPIFHVSNVTGEGHDLLLNFFNLLPKRVLPPSTEEVEYCVDSTFKVPGIGTVLGGNLHSGSIHVGDKLLLGPNDGVYREFSVRSIHCKRVPVQFVKCGSYVCVALKKLLPHDVRRGNVLISQQSEKVAVMLFRARITVMKCHSTTIRVGYEPVVHSSAIRQSARLMEVEKKICARNGEVNDDDDGILRTGDEAVVILRFCFQPEYLKPGSHILLCEGKTKVVGKVLGEDGDGPEVEELEVVGNITSL